MWKYKSASLRVLITEQSGKLDLHSHAEVHQAFRLEAVDGELPIVLGQSGGELSCEQEPRQEPHENVRADTVSDHRPILRLGDIARCRREEIFWEALAPLHELDVHVCVKGAEVEPPTTPPRCSNAREHPDCEFLEGLARSHVGDDEVLGRIQSLCTGFGVGALHFLTVRAIMRRQRARYSSDPARQALHLSIPPVRGVLRDIGALALVNGL